jgi:glucosylceramidase
MDVDRRTRRWSACWGRLALALAGRIGMVWTPPELVQQLKRIARRPRGLRAGMQSYVVPPWLGMLFGLLCRGADATRAARCRGLVGRGRRGLGSWLWLAVRARRVLLVALVSSLCAAPTVAHARSARIAAIHSAGRPSRRRKERRAKRRRASHLVAGPAVTVILTTHDLSRRLARMPKVEFSTAAARVRRTLHVDTTVTYQHMLGFGGAMTDSSAWLLYDELSRETRDTVMQSLFSTTRGIGLNFIRVPMGASDFSATGVPYSYDDLPASQTDPGLADFSIAHDEAYIIPTLQQMRSIDPRISLLATEWTPPSWMKANDAPDNKDYQGTLLPNDYAPLAHYFARFIAAYQAQGIPVWGVTPQNEPLSPAPFPGLNLPVMDEAQFITQDLAATLTADGLHTRIFGMDDSSDAYAESLMQTPAAQELAGMAWHCYNGQQIIGVFHAAYPAVVNLMSECSPGIIPYDAAEVAISGARNWASSIDLWNLLLDPSGGPVEPPNYGCPHCSGLVTVSETTHTAACTLNYYELGQFSKFIRRGAVRVATERWVRDFGKGIFGTPYGVTPGLDNVAFLNPSGTHVLVAYNNSAAPITFGVSWQDKRFDYKLASRATVTFTWN